MRGPGAPRVCDSKIPSQLFFHPLSQSLRPLGPLVPLVPKVDMSTQKGVEPRCRRCPCWPRKAPPADCSAASAPGSRAATGALEASITSPASVVSSSDHSAFTFWMFAFTYRKLSRACAMRLCCRVPVLPQGQVERESPQPSQAF